LHNVEVGHSFHDLLFHRDWKPRCILKELAPIKPLQVQFIGVYCAALLAPQVDPIQQGFLGIGDVVLAVSRAPFLETPEEIPR
jgi:hypothetical protein